MRGLNGETRNMNDIDTEERHRRIDAAITRTHRALVWSRTRLIEARRTGDLGPALTSLQRAWKHLDESIRACASVIEGIKGGDR